MEREMLEQYKAQEALQSQQLESQQSAYAPQMFEQVQQHQAVLVEQTNPKTIIKQIILRLQGREETEDGTIRQIAKPKMNKDGIDNVWYILESHINQNVILSSIELKDICKLMDSLQNDLVDDLSLNWKEYGIQKKTDLDTINNSILYNIYLALRRAEGRNEKNWLGRISVENISNASRMPQANKGGIRELLRL